MSKRIAVAGLIFGIAGLCVSAFACYSSYWIDFGSGTYSGLWKYDYQVEDGNWPDDVSGFSSSDRLHGYISRYAALGGAVLMLLSLAFTLAFICGQGKRAFVAVGGVLCMLSAGAHAAAVTLFRLKFELSSGQDYDIGFYMAIAAGVLGLLGGFFKIIAALRSGTKVETIAPALNTNRSNKSNKSNKGNQGNNKSNNKGNQNQKNANKNRPRVQRH